MGKGESDRLLWEMLDMISRRKREVLEQVSFSLSSQGLRFLIFYADARLKLGK